MMNIWVGLSLIGSMGVLAPAGVAIAVWLIAGNCWRLALNWGLLFGAGMLLVVVSKLVFIGWGIGIAAVGFAGFSGHAMRAAAVFPVFFFVALQSVDLRWRQLGVAAGVLLAILVGISRLVVQVHTVSEVISGTLLGLAVAFAFIWSAGSVRDFVLSRTLILASFAALLFTPKVEPVPTERIITQAALYLSGHERPFTRSDWHVRQSPYRPR